VAPRARGRAPAGRRRVELARSEIDATGLVGAGGANAFDVLSRWKSDLGILANIPGCTVMGIRYELAVRAVGAAATSVTTHFGFQVGDDTLDAVDIDPAAFLHQDWMILMRKQPRTLAIGDQQELVGTGDQGYAVVKSKRKLHEISDTLWFAYNVAFGGGGTMDLRGMFAVALALP
jgi:hypothetical protein